MASILLVEPDLPSQKTFVEVLKLMNHEVDAVIMGYSAISKFDPAKHDLVIMQSPPDMSGRHLAKRLFERGAQRIIAIASPSFVRRLPQPDPSHVSATIPFGAQNIEQIITEVLTKG